MKIKLLDCTLRDGGYVNNWEFSETEYARVLNSLKEAGVDCIEVGIMGKDKSNEFNTKYNSYYEIPSITRSDDMTIYTVMTTVGEAEDVPIPQRTYDTVDAIRIAFFKPDLPRMLDLADKVKSKGYKVFLQAMATYMYDEKELTKLITEVNSVEADAFYFVDSFGTLYPEDVRLRCIEIDRQLKPNIGLGFHAHNNRQLALANDISFLNSFNGAERETVYIDATIYGMGRGAGNTPIELLADYMNSVYGSSYNTGVLLDIFHDIISLKYKENYWGYDYLYYITSKLGINMVYVWYMRDIKGIKDDKIIGELLSQIPEQNRYTLNKRIVDELLLENGF